MIVPIPVDLAGGFIGSVLTISRLASKRSSLAGVTIAMMKSPMRILSCLMVALPGVRTIFVEFVILMSFLPSLSSTIRVSLMISLTLPIYPKFFWLSVSVAPVSRDSCSLFLRFSLT